MDVAVITDSTACLPRELLDDAASPVVVVPLGVTIDGETFTEGVDVDSAAVAEAQENGLTVTTSRPAPATLLRAYEQARDAGARAVVSVHCSSALSATVSSAHLAAVESPIPVTVIDSTTTGMAMGFAALAGARRAQERADVREVADVVRRVARTSVTTFYVDSLEPLRRGGRIGRAGALVGSALNIKPLLTVREGVIEPLERVRTTSRAMNKLVQRTVAALQPSEAMAPAQPVLAVHSLARADLAEQVRTQVGEGVEQDVPVWSVPLGAVVTAHVGAGTVATVVAHV